MKILIKNPAPATDQRQFWGDYHFGCALADALCSADASVQVEQQFWGEWDNNDADAVIALRGKRRFHPPSSVLSVLWAISHPAAICSDELSAYHHCYAASRTLAGRFQTLGARSVSTLYQCTDDSVFSPPDAKQSDMTSRSGEVMVASSRGVKRLMLQWALQAGFPPLLHGRHWDRANMDYLVQSEYVQNADLPNLYRSARFILNDHWEDMREFGVINNRIFDCMAVGAPVISDTFSEIEWLMGDAIVHCHGPADYHAAVTMGDQAYGDLLQRVQKWWQDNGHEFTFKARAQQILDDLNRIKAQTSAESFGRLEQENESQGDDLLSALLSVSARWAQVQVKNKRPRVLHLCPDPSQIGDLASMDEWMYLSSGPGAGPWQVSCERDFALIVSQFDLVVIDQASLLNGIAQYDRYLFIDALVSRLQPDGLILLRALDEGPDWASVLTCAGLVEVQRVEGWKVFRNRGDHAAALYEPLTAQVIDVEVFDTDSAL